MHTLKLEHRGRASWAIVTTLRCPLQQTIRFTQHHLNLGADRIFLYFDDPADAALAVLAEEPRITAVPCNTDHWRAVDMAASSPIEARQCANATLGLAQARALGLQWLAHIDADELILSRGDLGLTLARLAPQVAQVRFKLHEAVASELEPARPFDGVRWYKIKAQRWPSRLARLFGARVAFERGQYLRGHSASKCAVRTSAPIASIDIHAAHFHKAVVHHDARGIRLLHYDAMGVAAWREKWSRRLDGTALAVHMRDYRKQLLDRFTAAAAQGEPAVEALYRELYIITFWPLLVLLALGLLKHVSPTLLRFDGRLAELASRATESS